MSAVLCFVKRRLVSLERCSLAVLMFTAFFHGEVMQVVIGNLVSVHLEKAVGIQSIATDSVKAIFIGAEGQS